MRRLPRAVFPPPELDCGTDLTRHLQGCDAVLLMAATLGSQVDSLLRRLELTDIAMAAAADALSSVLLEQICDELEAEWRAKFAAEHLYLTGRYAPGYGDCPLELNDELCLAVDTVRGCGLAITPQHLLAPRKSSTAILGIADHPVTAPWQAAPPATCGRLAASANRAPPALLNKTFWGSICADSRSFRPPPLCLSGWRAWVPSCSSAACSPVKSRNWQRWKCRMS